MKQIQPIFLESIDSTNRALKQLAREGAPEGTLLIADRQEGGYGRLSRPFFSPERTGLYMSLLLRPTVSPQSASLITHLAALAVARAVRTLTGKDARIKWVNDIYIDGKKVAGILTESAFRADGTLDFVVLGIGVNLLPPDGGFPAYIQSTAGAVFDGEGEDFFSLRERLYRAIVQALAPLYDALPDTAFLSAYRALSLLSGKDVLVFDALTDREKSGKGTPARALDIAEGGGLLVEYENGEREVLTGGEVSLRIL